MVPPGGVNLRVIGGSFPLLYHLPPFDIITRPDNYHIIGIGTDGETTMSNYIFTMIIPGVLLLFLLAAVIVRLSE